MADAHTMTDKTKHTPGPWNTITTVHEDLYITAPHHNNHSVALVQTAFNLPAEANARLIAAAPDLLAFARECARSDSDCGEGVRALARDLTAKVTA